MLADLRADARPGVPWVFATSTGNYYLPSNVNRGYHQLLDALQAEQKRLEQTTIRRLKLHATRHTFASQAFAQMMDPLAAARPPQRSLHPGHLRALATRSARLHSGRFREPGRIGSQ